MSAIRFPLSTDTAALSDMQNVFVCASANIEDQFAALEAVRSEKFTYAYFGSEYGSFREYPAVGGECSDYDPRFRPWFIKAVTAPKNVVLLVDVSATMGDGSKLDILKASLRTILRKFSSVEHVSLITFNSATSPFAATVQQATDALIADLQTEASSITVSGTPDYEQAFSSALQQLNSANSDATDDEGAACDPSQNIILFVSDAMDASFDAAALETYIMDNKDAYDLKVFAFGIGADSASSNYAGLKDLTCAFEGMTFKMDSTEDSVLLTTMDGYEEFIAASANTTEPVWSDPYEDAFGFGQLFTVAMPVYYELEDGFLELAGVVGLDIKYDKMVTEFGLTEAEALSYLTQEVDACPADALDDCQKQYLRIDEAQCELTCDFTGLECANAQTADVFTDPVDTTTEVCCVADFIEFKEEMEGIVRGLANALTAAINAKCDSSVYDCPNKSFYSCEGTSAKSCLADFPTP